MSQRIIDHPRFGRGTVKKSVTHGFLLQVAFDNGEVHWVHGEDVKDANGVENLPPKIQSAKESVKAKETFYARQMLEAFRMGIVPHDQVSNFTFGRQSEIQVLKTWLGDTSGKNNVLFLVGNYGSGKTHLLNYAYSSALMDRFAVARVELDWNEVPLHKPKKVYSRLAQSLRFRTTGKPKPAKLRELIQESLDQKLLRDHLFLKHLSPQRSDVYWEWIEGSEAINRPYTIVTSGQGNYTWKEDDRSVPSLLDNGTAANIYCYLMSGLSWAAKNALGLKGLLLIIDEAEIATSFSYSSYQNAQGINMLNALVRTANNDPLLAGLPQTSGLIYSRWHDLVPFLYQIPSNLKIIFAFTDSYLLSSPNFKAVQRIALSKLSKEALHEVLENIYRVYEQGYGTTFDERSREQIARIVGENDGVTRRFVKASVEALDLYRLNSEINSAESGYA